MTIHSWLSLLFPAYLFVGIIIGCFFLRIINKTIQLYEEGEELDEEAESLVREAEGLIRFVGEKAFVAILLVLCMLFWLPFLLKVLSERHSK
jgi:hypothetical protein